MSELIYVRVDDIEWDIDHEDLEDNGVVAREDLDLPTTVIVPVADIVDRNDLNERICNYLSDGYGWLVKGYECKVWDDLEPPAPDSGAS